MIITAPGSYNTGNGNTNVAELIFNPYTGTATVSGGKLSISQGINNQSTSPQYIYNQVTLTGDNVWQSVGTTYFSGYISGNHSLNIAGNVNVSSQISSPNLTFTGGNSTVANVQMSGPLGIYNNASVNFSQYLTGQAIQVNTTGNVTFSGKVNSGALTIANGNVLITGTEDKNFSNTTVNGGTLTLSQDDGYALNGPLFVYDGSVIFDGANQVPQWSSITLGDGAYLNLNGTTQNISQLNIIGDSVIDFAGSSSLGVLWNGMTFSDGATLTIKNWVDAVDYFTATVNPGSEVLPRVIFEGYGEAAWNPQGGFIRPHPVVPEPSFTGIFLIGVLLAWIFTRRVRDKITSKP